MEPISAHKLTDANINAFSAAYKTEVALIKTVCEVEALGSGFFLLKDDHGKEIPGSEHVKILFEGHVFYRHLKKKNFDVFALSKSHPNIVYQKWTRQFYSKAPYGEHIRLNRAILIDREAAQMSASWGMFQVLGENFKSAGYESVQEMVTAYSGFGEPEQLRSFFVFLNNEDILKYLKAKDWRGFARRYNGPGYEENQYHTKLEQAYLEHSKV